MVQPHFVASTPLHASAAAGSGKPLAATTSSQSATALPGASPAASYGGSTSAPQGVGASSPARGVPGFGSCTAAAQIAHSATPATAGWPPECGGEVRETYQAHQQPFQQHHNFQTGAVRQTFEPWEPSVSSGARAAAAVAAPPAPGNQRYPPSTRREGAAPGDWAKYFAKQTPAQTSCASAPVAVAEEDWSAKLPPRGLSEVEVWLAEGVRSSLVPFCPDLGLSPKRSREKPALPAAQPTQARAWLAAALEAER